MKNEIGGYIEFEYYHGKEYHSDAIHLNCARNCLAYLIKVNNIKKIFIPYFLCSSVVEVCHKYNVEVEYYHIDEDFYPIIPSADFSKDWFYLVNYYGQITNKQIIHYSKIIKKLIVDNVQAFFQLPVQHIPTIYTCRKFFGVTDGAYLYSDKYLNEALETDISFERMEFLFGRFERTASEFYGLYSENNKLFQTEDIKMMSLLTNNLMKSFEYKMIKNIRTRNFNFYEKQFKNINKLRIKSNIGAFAYPLLIDNGEEIRKKLQKEKIYIPTLWPDVFDVCVETNLEYNFAKNILPLPVDQRYDIIDIMYLIEELLKCLKN